MKWLFIIPYYAPAWGYGGPPKLVSALAEGLAANHHDVTVLTTDVLNATQRVGPVTETRNGVRVIRCRTVSNWLAWHTKIIIPHQFAKLAAQYIQYSDFVYLSDFRHWQNAVALRYLLLFNKPYSLAAFGQMRIPHDAKWPIKLLYDRIWGRKLIQHAQLLLAQTQNEANDYLTLGAHSNQVKIIPLAEQPPSAIEVAVRGQFREKYHITEDTKLLLFVGRINTLKGLDILVASFAQLRLRLPTKKIKLVIVGRDDGYQTQLNQRIAQLHLSSDIIQTGPLYGADNAACYNDCNLFVFTPTYYEETSLATVRALSFGLPVLTVHQAELPYLDDYNAGATVDCTISTVTDKLTALLQNDKLDNVYRKNAQQLFRDHYTLDKTINHLEHDVSQIATDLPQ